MNYWINACNNKSNSGTRTVTHCQHARIGYCRNLLSACSQGLDIYLQRIKQTHYRLSQLTSNKLPESEHVAGDLCGIVIEEVITHSSPLTVVVDLQTSCSRVSMSINKSSWHCLYTPILITTESSIIVHSLMPKICQLAYIKEFGKVPYSFFYSHTDHKIKSYQNNYTILVSGGR